jgi:hypothetical protein
MELRINIPDEIAAQLPPNGTDISRWLLEMAALEGYKSGKLTETQLKQMLGFQTRLEVDIFLKRHAVYFEYADEDLALEAETSRKLMQARAER